MIIQIIGLPGSGKTTLALALKDKINAIHLNADKVRETLNSDLKFNLEDRIENARRLGHVARLISDQNQNVIVDFVCPTSETRKAFGKADILIWMNTIESSRFHETDVIWEPVENADYVVSEFEPIENLVNKIIVQFKLNSITS
jgi:adenylylsulfate kinase